MLYIANGFASWKYFAIESAGLLVPCHSGFLVQIQIVNVCCAIAITFYNNLHVQVLPKTKAVFIGAEREMYFCIFPCRLYQLDSVPVQVTVHCIAMTNGCLQIIMYVLIMTKTLFSKLHFQTNLVKQQSVHFHVRCRFL